MVRCSRRQIGVRFHPDCPDHVKARAFSATLDATSAAERIQIAHCDHEWITRIDERVPGWWFPFIGFVPDTHLRAIAARLRTAVGRMAHGSR